MGARLPKQVVSGVYQLGLVGVNVFFLELADGGLVLIDTGTEPGGERVGAGLRALGRAPKELRGIVVTHLHGDHTGGLAAVKRHTGAEVWMHAADAAALREGVRARPFQPGPGVVRTVVAHALGLRPARNADPISVEHEVGDGETLPFDGLVAVHTPGHTAGHLALLLPKGGGVLFTGDAATNLGRLGVGPVYEDIAEGRRSLEKLAALDFDTALFSHGRPIRTGAGERFRARFARG
jgi:glyoxylase-like metal-dependent hydrolase (beta-lactamase superfamily II)